MEDYSNKVKLYDSSLYNMIKSYVDKTDNFYDMFSGFANELSSYLDETRVFGEDKEYEDVKSYKHILNVLHPLDYLMMSNAITHLAAEKEDE